MLESEKNDGKYKNRKQFGSSQFTRRKESGDDLSHVCIDMLSSLLLRGAILPSIYFFMPIAHDGILNPST